MGLFLGYTLNTELISYEIFGVDELLQVEMECKSIIVGTVTSDEEKILDILLQSGLSNITSKLDACEEVQDIQTQNLTEDKNEIIKQNTSTPNKEGEQCTTSSCETIKVDQPASMSVTLSQQLNEVEPQNDASEICVLESGMSTQT